MVLVLKVPNLKKWIITVSGALDVEAGGTQLGSSCKKKKISHVENLTEKSQTKHDKQNFAKSKTTENRTTKNVFAPAGGGGVGQETYLQAS